MSVMASHSCFCSSFTSHPHILLKYLQNVLGMFVCVCVCVYVFVCVCVFVCMYKGGFTMCRALLIECALACALHRLLVCSRRVL